MPNYTVEVYQDDDHMIFVNANSNFARFFNRYNIERIEAGYGYIQRKISNIEMDNNHEGNSYSNKRK